jgi:hypothetical protein
MRMNIEKARIKVRKEVRGNVSASTANREFAAENGSAYIDDVFLNGGIRDVCH